MPRSIRMFRLVLAIAVMVAGSVAVVGSGSAALGAAANTWPHTVVNGFSTPSGAGYWLVYADGTVTAGGDARWHGDASSIALNGPIVGGAVTPDGNGYWLVASDGGIFTYGDAHFYGSMGAAHLNQPVFSMSPTRTGRGYWLVARDGGIFSFGDAKFYGSAGSLPLRQPIVGITTSPSGRGYRMVAGDGGIFSFGDTPYYGSLPGLGFTDSTNIIGMAPTPTNKGYWISDNTGTVTSFGDAFSNLSATSTVRFVEVDHGCDPIVAIFSNPKAQGFRIVGQSGATYPAGKAPPGGSKRTGTPVACPPAPPPPPYNPPTMSLAEFNAIQPGMSYAQVVSIVGGPGTLAAETTFPGVDTKIYTWVGQGSVGANANVEFQNDREVAKGQAGLA